MAKASRLAARQARAVEEMNRRLQRIEEHLGIAAEEAEAPAEEEAPKKKTASRSKKAEDNEGEE